MAGVVDVANSHEDVVYRLYASSLHQVELVLKRKEHVFHVLPDSGDQVQAFLQQLLHQGGEVAPVPVALALQPLEQIPQHLVVVVGHVGRGDEQAGQLPVLVDDQVQLEAVKPAGGALSPRRYPLEDTVLMNAEVVADGQLLGVDVVVLGSLGKACPALGQEEGVEAGLAGEGEELGVRNSRGEEALQLPEHQALVVVLEALEAREVVKCENGEHLALGEGGPPAGGVLFKEPLWQRMVGEVIFDLLTEIVYEAEHFNYFGSIYDKVHKAKELGETSNNISTCSLAFFVAQMPDFKLFNSRVHVNTNSLSW